MIINPINGNSGPGMALSQPGGSMTGMAPPGARLPQFGAGVPLQNPGSGTPGGQMPMGQPPQQGPTFNAPGQGGFRANGQNVFGQNPQQAQRAQMMGQINNGTFGIRTGAPSQQDLVKQYALAQQLRGANWRG